MMWIIYGIGIGFALFLIVSILAICRSGGKEDEMMERLRTKAKERDRLRRQDIISDIMAGQIEIIQWPKEPEITPSCIIGCKRKKT